MDRTLILAKTLITEGNDKISDIVKIFLSKTYVNRTNVLVKSLDCFNDSKFPPRRIFPSETTSKRTLSKIINIEDFNKHPPLPIYKVLITRNIEKCVENKKISYCPEEL